MELLLCKLFIEHDNDSLVYLGMLINVCLYLFTKCQGILFFKSCGNPEFRLLLMKLFALTLTQVFGGWSGVVKFSLPDNWVLTCVVAGLRYDTMFIYRVKLLNKC